MSVVSSVAPIFGSNAGLVPSPRRRPQTATILRRDYDARRADLADDRLEEPHPLRSFSAARKAKWVETRRRRLA